MRFFLVMTLSVFCQVATAQPKVIADYGGEPIGLQAPNLSNAKVPNNLKYQPRFSYDIQYPVVSSLTPGLVSRRTHGRNLGSSVFIIGADRDSLAWLEANYRVLVDKKALGFVTNINDADSFARIQKRFPNLEFSTVPIQSIADAYHLKHYPVLIDQKEIVQ